MKRAIIVQMAPLQYLSQRGHNALFSGLARGISLTLQDELQRFWHLSQRAGCASNAVRSAEDQPVFSPKPRRMHMAAKNAPICAMETPISPVKSPRKDWNTRSNTCAGCKSSSSCQAACSDVAPCRRAPAPPASLYLVPATYAPTPDYRVKNRRIIYCLPDAPSVSPHQFSLWARYLLFFYMTDREYLSQALMRATTQLYCIQRPVRMLRYEDL